MRLKTKTLNITVRLIIIIMAVYSFLETALVFFDIYEPAYSYLFGHSFIVGLLLCILVSEQGSYHCKYMRILAYYITATNLITFLDLKYDIFVDHIYALITIILIWLATIFALLYLAVNHFRNAIKAKKEREKLNNK